MGHNHNDDVGLFDAISNKLLRFASWVKEQTSKGVFIGKHKLDLAKLQKNKLDVLKKMGRLSAKLVDQNHIHDEEMIRFNQQLKRIEEEMDNSQHKIHEITNPKIKQGMQ